MRSITPSGDTACQHHPAYEASSTGEKIHSINITLAVATAIVAIVVGVTGFVLKEVWDISKPMLVQRLAQPQASPATKTEPPPPAAPPATK